MVKPTPCIMSATYNMAIMREIINTQYRQRRLYLQNHLAYMKIICCGITDGKITRGGGAVLKSHMLFSANAAIFDAGLY